MKAPKSKKTKKSRNPFITGAIVLVIAIAFGFIIRGWIRVTAVPKLVTVSYGNSVKKTLNSELVKLNEPLKALGYTNSEYEDSGCRLTAARKFTTEIQCTYTLNAFKEVSQNPADKKIMNDESEKILSLLKANGWGGEYSSKSDLTSLTTLVKNINKGIDYTPDAAYDKKIGKVECLFDSNTSFSSPKPPAISSRFTCTRVIHILGTLKPEDTRIIEL